MKSKNQKRIDAKARRFNDIHFYQICLLNEDDIKFYASELNMTEAEVRVEMREKISRAKFDIQNLQRKIV